MNGGPRTWGYVVWSARVRSTSKFHWKVFPLCLTGHIGVLGEIKSTIIPMLNQTKPGETGMG